MTHTRSTLAACLVIGLAVTIAAQTTPAKLVVPPAIDAAFKKAYPNATIKNIAKEKEDGVDQYEVESVDGGLSRDLVYLVDGSLVDIEEEVSEANLPQAVTAAIKARYPTAKITRREKVTITKGNIIEYEVGLSGAGKVTEVTLTPDGKWVSPK